MPPIVRLLLSFAVIVVIIVAGFQIHWLLGVGVIAAILIYSVWSNRAIIYAQRGNIAYMKGDEEKALEHLEQAYRTKRGNPQHMVGYAYLLIKKGRLEEAEKILKDILSGGKLPDQIRMQAHVNLATVYWLQGHREQCIKLLEEEQEKLKHTKLYGNLGYYKILLGTDYEAALEYNKEAYEYNDNDVTIIDNLAQNYYFLGRYEEAAEVYEKLMEKSPKSADSYYFYARTLKELGRTDEARDMINKALDKPLATVTPLTRDEVKRLAEELKG